MNAQSPWDVAIRYHEIKAGVKDQKHIQLLRSVSAWAVLEKARQLLGSVSHPTVYMVSPSDDVPSHAQDIEMDFETTLEESCLEIARNEANASDLWVSYRQRRQKNLILCVDTSLSMTGEKLALTAVALAVVLLQFPEDPLGIVAFETGATVLKAPDEFISLFELLQRFLDVPAQGYTHLEAGLQKALALQEGVGTSGGGSLWGQAKGPRSVTSTVLLTDGKYTAGRDPAYLANRFPHLVVLKMGLERAGFGLCEELARGGQGQLKEVSELEELPSVMYSVVKDLVRGK